MDVEEVPPWPALVSLGLAWQNPLPAAFQALNGMVADHHPWARAHSYMPKALRARFRGLRRVAWKFDSRAFSPKGMQACSRGRKSTEDMPNDVLKA